MQAYWWVVRILLTPPAEAAASQKWKIIYLYVLNAFTENTDAHIGFAVSSGSSVNKPDAYLSNGQVQPI